MSLLPEVLGWVGAGSLLGAYALVSHGRVTGDGRAFQALNLLGATGLLVNGVQHEAWPSAALNTTWLVVGLAAALRAHRTRTGQDPDSHGHDAPGIHHPHRQEQP